MCLPELGLGAQHVQNVGLLGLDQGLFDWYSKKSAGSAFGFIGANVLKSFRLEIDFPNQMTYWEAGSLTDPNDLDIVGLTLRPEADSPDIANPTMGTVVGALRGKPESTRTLVLERAGERVTVQARVVRFP